jgi:hypothetical protein
MISGALTGATLEMMPPVGLQESRIIKGLPRGGTLEPLSVLFSFSHYGVPPKRLTSRLSEGFDTLTPVGRSWGRGLPPLSRRVRLVPGVMSGSAKAVEGGPRK